jgi:hypothetical protein
MYLCCSRTIPLLGTWKVAEDLDLS